MTHSSPRPSPSPLSELRPALALLTPVWLGALALLVANDHWLKGSGLVPGLLTGKLSDFAGMLVAPVLLATLLRVNTRRGLLACHIAVGGVFAGIQLSVGFAAQWSALMGLFGHPWQITCDPTDLIALPFLWLSWHALVPAMDGDRPALVGLRRSAVAGVSVFGLWATVATSDDVGSEDCFDCWDTGTESGDASETEEATETETETETDEVFGHVYLHNPNSFGISVSIRELGESIDLNCAAIAEDPSRLLPDAAFGEATQWELQPGANLAIVSPLACGAVKIGGEGIDEQLVFANPLPLTQFFPASHEALSQLSPQGAAIVFDDEGSEWIGGESWRHAPKTQSAPVPEPCMASEAERSFEWGALADELLVEVVSISAQVEGCTELQLLPQAGGEPHAWELCVPEATIRFAIGEHYRLTSSADAGEWVEAQLVDPETFAPQLDELGRALLTMRWVSGMSYVHDFPLAFEAAAVDTNACPWVAEQDPCARVSRTLELALGGIVELHPGEPELLTDALGVRHEITLGRARAVALTDSACAPGSALPHDIDYALVSTPN